MVQNRRYIVDRLSGRFTDRADSRHRGPGHGCPTTRRPLPRPLRRGGTPMTESRRLRLAAAALTLLSGALMTLAGYIGQTESWARAGLITIPGGIVILAASALGRRADR